MNKVKMLAISALTYVAGSFAAHAVVIDFDDLSADVAVTDQYAAQGILFDQAATFNFSQGSAPRAICGAPSGSGNANCMNDILITFVDPTDSLVDATTDFFSVNALDVQLTTNYIEIFDLAGDSLGIFNLPSSPLVQLISFNVAGIHSVVMHGLGDVAFDDITFNEVTVGDTPDVPEPASLGLLGLGLVGMGALARRRRS